MPKPFHPNEKKTKEVFFRLIVQGKREKCYYQFWQITNKDAKKLRDNVLKDEKLHQVQEQPYFIYGKNSYLTRFG